MTVEIPERHALRTVAEMAIGHPLSVIEATVICDELALRHVHVAVRFEVDGWVHLWQIEPCTTTEEVTALRAFAAITDQTLVWHPYLDVAR